jgi:hypothetical protein
MRKRVRLALESDHIGVWPDEAARRARSAAQEAEQAEGAEEAASRGQETGDGR